MAERHVNTREQLPTDIKQVLGPWIQQSLGDITIALPGGRSITVVLDALVQLCEGNPQALNRVHIFQLDEFRPTPERQESNWDILNQHFFQPALRNAWITQQQLHRLLIEEDPQASIDAYLNELDTISQTGRFDIVVLGAGGGNFPDGSEDMGHVAAIFPRSDNVWNTSARFTVVTDAPKPPEQRVTATPNLIAQAKFGIGLVLGEEKRNAYSRYDSPGIAVRNCPLKLLNRTTTGHLFTDLEV